MATYPVLEHGTTRAGRWLRTNRVRLALLVAVAETVLVVANVVQWRWALVIAGTVFAFHFFVGRRVSHDAVRQLSWTAAVSQTIPVLVPVLAAAALTVVVLGIVAAAIVVLALVLLGRR